MVSSVAIRLGTDGKAQVKADFAEIADSGDASAKRLASSYQKASDDIAAATKRQADAAAKISAIMPSSTQAVVNANVGTTAAGGYRDAGGGASTGQNANAAQYAALLAKQEQQAERVRAAIDPLYTAQKRYDAEIATAGGLLSRGVISEAEHAAAVTLSGKALQEAKNALEGHAGAMGLNRQQTIIAQSALLRFTDAVIAGRNPLTAFALEAHKGVEVLSSDDGGMAGGLAKVSSFINPVSVGIAALTAVLAIGTAAWVSYEDAIDKFDSLSVGAGAVIGVTGQQLEANAEAASRNSNETVGAARDIETAYVRMGGIGSDVLTGLTSMTADFAAATGQDAKGATQQLGKAFEDPVKGAEDLAARYGVLSTAQIEQIRQLADMGDLYGAQAKLLGDLQPAFDGAASHARGFAAAFDAIKKGASEAFAAVGKFANEHGPGILFDTTGIALPGVFDGNGPPPKAAPNAQGRAFAEQAQDASADFTGRNQLQALQAKRAQLKRALDNPGAVSSLQQAGALDQTRQALEAYTHAIDTYLPPAEKKRQIDIADVAIARARASRNPAALAAASSRKEEIEQSGLVATKADVEADALAEGERARARLDGAGAKHAETLAREAAAMDATTRGALAAATAYLSLGAAAGEEADATGKATAAATKSGADVSAQVRRQLAQSVAEGNEAGAKAISTLRLETSARTQVNLATEQGRITVDQMGQSLSDENALRELTIKQSLAQRLGLTADYDAITATIKAYRQALDEAHASEADSGSLKALDDIRKRVEDAQLAKRFAGDTSGGYDRARDALAANRAADANHDNADQRTARVNASGSATDQELDAKRSAVAADAIRASNDNLAINEAQLGIIGKSSDAQQLIVDKLKLQQSLAVSLGDQYDQYAPAILAAAGAADTSSLHLKQAQDTMSALRQDGDKFIDDLTNPKGGGLKTLLKDAKQELEQMALINPLKNLLGGQQLPTLGGLFGGGSSGGSGGLAGGISKLLGGHSGGILGGISKLLGFGKTSGIGSLVDHGGLPDQLAMPNYDFTSSLFHFAAGTEYSPAGPAWVGENGPEIVNLPGGSKITNAADTRRMLTAGNDNSAVHNHFHLDHPVVTQDLLDQMNAIGNRSAAQGASQGAQQATRAAAVQKRRSFRQS